MTEIKKYNISTLSDILALSPDQRVRCADDLVGWIRECNRLMEDTNALGIVIAPIGTMIWVDDDLPPGTMSGVKIKML